MLARVGKLQKNNNNNFFFGYNIDVVLYGVTTHVRLSGRDCVKTLV